MDRAAVTASPPQVPPRFDGWRMVAVAFVLAVFGWGIGFYGPPVYLETVRRANGWPVALVSGAVTVHFLAGVGVVASLPRLHGRFGLPAVTVAGAAILSLGVWGWSLARDPWFLYGAAALTGIGWPALGAAAVNAIVSPWFDRKRPAALGMAYNGASIGGVIFSPLWVALIERIGFQASALAVGFVTLATTGALALGPLRRTPASRGQESDGGGAPPAGGASAYMVAPAGRLSRDRAFLTLALGMALALFAQIGLLAQLVSVLVPALGVQGAGLAAGLATGAAILGRLLVGAFMQPGADRRLVCALSLVVQATGASLMALAGGSPPLLLAGTVLVGLGIGNATSLPPLIAQSEFARAEAGRVVALIVAVSQGAYAFAPAIFGLLRQEAGDAAVFALAVLVQGGAVAAYLSGCGAARRRPVPPPSARRCFRLHPRSMARFARKAPLRAIRPAAIGSPTPGADRARSRSRQTAGPAGCAVLSCRLVSRIAFVAPPFLGHLNPMAALASELVRRGHAVVHYGIADAEPLARERALAFRPVGQRSHPPGHLAHLRRRMMAGGHPFGIQAVLRDVAAMTDMLCRDLPDALRAERVDLLVCDGTEAAGWLVGAHLGLPVVTVANALPLNREPGIPPPFTGWRYDPRPEGLRRNRGGYRVADRMMVRQSRVIADWATRWSLPPRRRVDECLSDLAQISQTVASFDYPRREAPDHFHPVGPLRTAARPRPAATARRVGFGSLGTLQGGRSGLFRAVAAGIAGAGLEPVLAHGGALGPAAIARLPREAAVFPFVDQEEVLSRAAVAVLNCGLNTVMDALAAGVPILAIPIAFEQGAIAARIERVGAGRRLSRILLGPGRIAETVRAILVDPSTAEAAGRLAAEIAAAGGTARAADIVERVLATGRPVPFEATQTGIEYAA